MYCFERLLPERREDARIAEALGWSDLRVTSKGYLMGLPPGERAGAGAVEDVPEFTRFLEEADRIRAVLDRTG